LGRESPSQRYGKRAIRATAEHAITLRSRYEGAARTGFAGIVRDIGPGITAGAAAFGYRPITKNATIKAR